jgi:ribose transport system permease protein
MAQRSAAVLSKGPRFQVSKGLLTVLVSTVVLYALCAIAAPSSVAPNTILGTLEFAAILAIAGLGQMLVIQQAGIDLSVAGAISLAAVIVTAVPDGDNSKLGSAILLALAVALGFGLLNGFLIGYLKLNPIIATLGSNAALYGLVMGISQGIPRSTTPMLMEIVSGVVFWASKLGLLCIGFAGTCGFHASQNRSWKKI